MLEIGNEGLWGGKANMTVQERRSHMALWCIFAAPLILGGDVRTLSAGDLAIVSNPHLIRINQDRMGTQGRCIRGCPRPADAQNWAATSLANFTAAQGSCQLSPVSTQQFTAPRLTTTACLLAFRILWCLTLQRRCGCSFPQGQRQSRYSL